MGILERLKWWFARDEMLELERRRASAYDYQRWFASMPDIRFVIENLEHEVSGCPMWAATTTRLYSMTELRIAVREERARQRPRRGWPEQEHPHNNDVPILIAKGNAQ